MMNTLLEMLGTFTRILMPSRLLMGLLVALLSVNFANAYVLKGLTKQGQGQMNILFWSVYQAEYYTDKCTYSINQPSDLAQSKQALKLTYLRDITKSELINATNDQWQHLQLTLPNKAQWLSQLENIWPDIYENDTLTLFVDESNVSHFYLSNAQSDFVKTGEIADKDFSDAFLAIWLSEDTSRPELRKQLLGMQ